MCCKNTNAKETHFGACCSRPDLYGIIIPGKHGKLLATLYTAGGEGPHPTILLLHGIPGCEQNLDLAQAFRRAGFHVMTFHYSGSWGSSGNYSLQNDLDDAETVLDFILNDTTYGFNKDKIYVAGHSLGGFVCGQITARRSEIKGAALLMPCNIGRIGKITQNDPENAKVLKDVLNDSVNWLTGLTEDCLYKEAIEHEKEFALEYQASALSRKPLLCITGSLDICTPKKEHLQPVLDAIKGFGGTMASTLEYPTDHFFSDYRLEICDVVTGFFKNLTV